MEKSFIEKYKEFKFDGKIGYFDKDTNFASLAKELGYNVGNEEGFDEYISNMTSFISELERIMAKIIGIKKALIVTDKGRIAVIRGQI